MEFQEIDYEFLKQSYKEDFILDAKSWRQRVDSTNSIVLDTLSHFNVDDFQEFTYNEYCILCETNFNKILDDSEIGYYPEKIAKSQTYKDIVAVQKKEAQEALRIAIEDVIEKQLEIFYADVNRENFMSAIKIKCGNFLSDTDLADMEAIWRKLDL